MQCHFAEEEGCAKKETLDIDVILKHEKECRACMECKYICPKVNANATNITNQMSC